MNGDSSVSKQQNRIIIFSVHYKGNERRALFVDQKYFNHCKKENYELRVHDETI